MVERERHESANAAAQRRCLLLLPRGYDAPPMLLDGLRRRCVSVREVADCPAVMVELARGPYVSLVVVEPAVVADLSALVKAVRRYHAPLPVWQYVGEPHPRLTRLQPVTGQTPQPQQQAPPGGNGQHAAETQPPLDSPPPMERTPSSSEPAVARRYDVALTPEELAMLLEENAADFDAVDRTSQEE